MKRVLVAGIGNIFLGDDAFGCEVIRELCRFPLPAGVSATDFGIRGYDLACALTEGFDGIILVDATPRGEPPGTVYLIEPDLNEIGKLTSSLPDGHSLVPVKVLQMAQTLGDIKGKLFLVGCEPAVLESSDGELGLSEPVRNAVPRALEMIESVLRTAFDLTKETMAGFAPA